MANWKAFRSNEDLSCKSNNLKNVTCMIGHERATENRKLVSGWKF